MAGQCLKARFRKGVEEHVVGASFHFRVTEVEPRFFQGEGGMQERQPEGRDAGGDERSRGGRVTRKPLFSRRPLFSRASLFCRGAPGFQLVFLPHCRFITQIILSSPVWVMSRPEWESNKKKILVAAARSSDLVVSSCRLPTYHTHCLRHAPACDTLQPLPITARDTTSSERFRTRSHYTSASRAETAFP